MSWAAAHIARLRRGETVSFRPTGNSMRPHVRSGQLVTVVPTTWEHVALGDIVLCRVGGAEYLHLVGGIDRERGCRIVNAAGRENGWTCAVFGKLVTCTTESSTIDDPPATPAGASYASIGAVLGVGAAAGDVQSFEAGVRRGREEIIARIREQARRTQRPGFTWNDLADALERELRVLA